MHHSHSTFPRYATNADIKGAGCLCGAGNTDPYGYNPLAYFPVHALLAFNTLTLRAASRQNPPQLAIRAHQ